MFVFVRLSELKRRSVRVPGMCLARRRRAAALATASEGPPRTISRRVSTCVSILRFDFVCLFCLFCEFVERVKHCTIVPLFQCGELPKLLLAAPRLALRADRDL